MINTELKNIFSDFRLFASSFLNIRSNSTSIDKLILNKEQNYIYSQIQLQKKETSCVRVIILKGRQIGSTTYVCADNLYNLMTHRGYKSLVMSHRSSSTNSIFDIILRYISGLPQNINPKIRVNANKFIKFLYNDSSISFFTAGSREVGRSETVNMFHGSEVAFWDNASNHLSSIFMAVPDTANSSIILESTSAGPSGVFYDMCMEAYHKNSQFKMIFIPWHWHLEYQEDINLSLPNKWIEYGKLHGLSNNQLQWAFSKNRQLVIGENIEDGPSVRFLREFPSSLSEAFLIIENDNLISFDKLYKRAISVSDLSHNSSIRSHFEHAKKLTGLILGIDVATTGKDKTCIIDRVGNFLGFTVNESYSNISTMVLTGLIIQHIKTLSPIKICIDAMGGGVGVYDRLVEMGYGNIVELVYFSQKSNTPHKHLNKRAQMWDDMREFIEQDNSYIVKHEDLMQQLSSVKYFYNSQGQLQLESKDNLKKRLKCSCDYADAAVLTFASSNINLASNSIYTQSADFYNPLDW